MDKKKKMILVVLVVVVAAAGALFFYFKNKAQAVRAALPGQPSPTGSGYQVVTPGIVATASPTLSDLKSATWQTQKGGVIISGGRWASGELVSLNGTTVKQTNPAWTGQLVRGGSQINWQKSNGELDVWVRVA